MFGGALILTLGFVHVLAHSSFELSEQEHFPVGASLCLGAIMFMVMLEQLSIELVNRSSSRKVHPTVGR